jgi:hypothetical protein
MLMLDADCVLTSLLKDVPHCSRETQFAYIPQSQFKKKLSSYFISVINKYPSNMPAKKPGAAKMKKKSVRVCVGFNL